MSQQRFHDAQTGRSSYASALAETQRGQKRSHWIWFIFPQIEGLGSSSTARAYAIRDLDEARAYLRDPILRSRYEEIAGAVAEQLARDTPLEQLMGSAIDAQKLASSLTLFRTAAQSLTVEDSGFTALASLCESLLQKTAAQGYGPCAFTLARVS